jgi:hypothetical protein
MAETLSYPDVGDDADGGPDRGVTTGISRWQKVVGILGLVVVLGVGDRISNVIFGSGLGPVGDRIGDVIFGDGGGPGGGGGGPGGGGSGGGGHTPGPPEGGHG